MDTKSLVTHYTTTVEENIQLLRDHYAQYQKAKESKKIVDELIITLLQLNVEAIDIAEAMKVHPSEITRIKKKYLKGGELRVE